MRVSLASFSLVLVGLRGLVYSAPIPSTLAPALEPGIGGLHDDGVDGLSTRMYRGDPRGPANYRGTTIQVGGLKNAPFPIRGVGRAPLRSPLHVDARVARSTSPAPERVPYDAGYYQPPPPPPGVVFGRYAPNGYPQNDPNGYIHRPAPQPYYDSGPPPVSSSSSTEGRYHHRGETRNYGQHPDVLYPAAPTRGSSLRSDNERYRSGSIPQGSIGGVSHEYSSESEFEDSSPSPSPSPPPGGPRSFQTGSRHSGGDSIAGGRWSGAPPSSSSMAYPPPPMTDRGHQRSWVNGGTGQVPIVQREGSVQSASEHSAPVPARDSGGPPMPQRASSSTTSTSSGRGPTSGPYFKSTTRLEEKVEVGPKYTKFKTRTSLEATHVILTHDEPFDHEPPRAAGDYPEHGNSYRPESPVYNGHPPDQETSAPNGPETPRNGGASGGPPSSRFTRLDPDADLNREFDDFHNRRGSNWRDTKAWKKDGGNTKI